VSLQGAVWGETMTWKRSKGCSWDNPCDGGDGELDGIRKLYVL
jgi:hypothetical protein